MEIFKISVSADSTGEELAPIALAVHKLLGLPVTMRSLNKKGVRIEKGKVLDTEYTGPVLEQVLKENKVIRTIPNFGKYAGIPVVVAPIRDHNYKAIAAIGIVDLVGSIDLGVIFSDHPDIIKQVHACLKARVTSP
ncbi:MAG TPA: DUF2111 domain-containing protein [Methanosarcinales archaeon]|nr:DUF2111 domain-containing protein [Methanosarcinales archaeon]